MNEQDDSKTSDADYMKDVLRIVNELAQKSMMDDYLYRGESECYPKVSSSLYREYSEIAENLDISFVQKAMLEAAKEFVGKIDENDLLAELQHFECSTNLIDFTTTITSRFSSPVTASSKRTDESSSCVKPITKS